MPPTLAAPGAAHAAGETIAGPCRVHGRGTAPAVRSAIEARRPCEVGVVLRSARLMRVGSTCLGRPSEDGPNEGWGFHERRKRSSAGSLINPRNLLWACPRCNGFVEAEPALMRAHFGTALVVREGDQEWDGLGKRADR